MREEYHAKETKDIMNALQVKGRWNIAKGKLKQKIAHLMDDDLQFTDGKEDELLGLIQKRKGQEINGPVPAMEPCCTCHHSR